MALTKVYDAATVFKHLNGILNVFKPAGMKVKHVRNAILSNICKGLNSLEQRNSEGPQLGTGTAADTFLHRIASNSDFLDYALSPGLGYLPSDVQCSIVSPLGDQSSGVLLFGINKGIGAACGIQRNRLVRVFHVTGRLGASTENHLVGSRVTARSQHRHVSADRISGLAASMQASHQRKMYELCGIDLQTHAAFELACKGLIRPADNREPLLYGIKLIHFERPFFTLELHTASETEEYLAALVHDMGLELRTTAHTIQLRCVRHAHFEVGDSLLRHGWHLPGIMRNLRHQQKVLKEHPQLLQQKRIDLHA
ncbi:hypothetical protein KR018_003473 [Drosophila ironensis]|nr:hypothetical protein KR018_003473 [Drosophila ironensis]